MSKDRMNLISVHPPCDVPYGQDRHTTLVYVRGCILLIKVEQNVHSFAWEIPIDFAHSQNVEASSTTKQRVP